MGGNKPAVCAVVTGNVTGFETNGREQARRICCCCGKLTWKCGVLVVYDKVHGPDGLKGAAH